MLHVLKAAENNMVKRLDGNSEQWNYWYPFLYILGISLLIGGKQMDFKNKIELKPRRNHQTQNLQRFLKICEPGQCGSLGKTCLLMYEFPLRSSELQIVITATLDF